MVEVGRAGGFIAIHRRIESWPLWQAMSGEHRSVWLSLLLAANWKDSEVWVRSGRLVVKRGQALIAQRTLADRARASHRSVRTALRLLTQEGAVQVTHVATQASRRASLVTIVNYDAYQGEATQEATQARHDQNKGNKEASRSDRNSTEIVSPFVDRRGAVIKLNPDDVLSDWDCDIQGYVPRGLTSHGREVLRARRR